MLFSQSAQLYLEAMIFCLGPVWSLTPSFRAEKSRTVRNLTEFLHLEVETPWVSLEDILRGTRTTNFIHYSKILSMKGLMD